MATPDFVLALREHVGHDLLWMPGVTAFVLDADRQHMLAVRRADTGAWTPVTGIIDPGEEPASAAVREVAEEAGVDCAPLRLVDVRTHPPLTFPNGDHAQFLDLCFVCEHTGGEPYPADGENTEARWFPLEDPPPMNDRFLAQLQIVLADRPEARFRR
ncbi:NUDIX hydrolase [Brachybacterium alimentarium]|uniref:NUDIX hydrolase n=1 Tax=Brachybacterium alimentarium TaxID=47845 RepID=UPI000DF16CBB|nr:NUDIX domain-containing protein [Brachybacterium alimentarium]RCS68456.1 NUDIX domain-containing protein [Brachybacterium alimentarium]RCS76946.1 NUDIX domain-containing protein [Brachybacterium alimentarium]RCS84214.1 NUDIX domain-containing protein [Brachybacterium alimentarium]